MCVCFLCCCVVNFIIFIITHSHIVVVTFFVGWLVIVVIIVVVVGGDVFFVGATKSNVRHEVHQGRNSKQEIWIVILRREHRSLEFHLGLED